MGKPLSVQVLEALGKDWRNASLTREAHLLAAKDFANFVEKNFGLEKLQNLKPGHVEAYAKNMHGRVANGTACNRMAVVRDIAQAIGKANIVSRDNAAYGINRGERSKPVMQNVEKVNAIRAAICALANAGDRVAIMCHAAAELRDAFGMRAKESLMSHKIIERMQALVIEGAKGGRPNQLEFLSDRQAQAAAQIAVASKMLGSKSGRIIPPEMSLKMAYDAQRNLWRSLGGTKENGAHMHSDRHRNAQEMHAAGYSNAEIMGRYGHGEDRSPFFYIPK